CRKFIAVGLDRFWQWYRDAPVPRHFYEIIQEERPCRPYFDLEFAKDLNPGLDAGEALRDFLALCREMFAELNVVLTDRHFLVLESSSDKKFSVHVVIHLPGKRLLPDNIAMKPFVERMRARMQETGRGVVKAAKGDGVVCDHTVYTKNRNFRLYLSSKCGKDATLRLPRSCGFYGDGPPKKTDIFFDSLVVPRDWDSGDYEILDLSALQQQPIRAVASAQPVQRETRRMVGTFSLRCNEQVEELAKCAGPSPFTVLDAFMLDFLRQFTPSVAIRQWTLYIYRPIDSRSIQYELSNCRYCMNIGREHKRHKVVWKVDLDQFNFFQMCFDVADCPKFISDIFDLPAGIQDKLRTFIGRRPVNVYHVNRVF
ncbi:DNA primase, partial [Aphelenchoides avenae]